MYVVAKYNEYVHPLSILMSMLQQNTKSLMYFHWHLVAERDEMGIEFYYESAQEFYTERFLECFKDKIKEAKLIYLQELLDTVSNASQK